jgi:hypothetical protein
MITQPLVIITVVVGHHMASCGQCLGNLGPPGCQRFRQLDLCDSFMHAFKSTTNAHSIRLSVSWIRYLNTNSTNNKANNNKTNTNQPTDHNQPTKQASKQTSKQASKQASKQTSKQANKQANKQASKQTSKQASTKQQATLTDTNILRHCARRTTLRWIAAEGCCQTSWWAPASCSGRGCD